MKNLILLLMFLPVGLRAQMISTLPMTGAVPVYNPDGIIRDSAGNIYIAEFGSGRIKMRAPSGMVTTRGGTGFVTKGSMADDGGPATLANIDGPMSVALDKLGNIYFDDVFDHAVRKISTTGIISTLAGQFTSGYSGNGGPARAAFLHSPTCVIFDTDRNMYIADEGNNVIRKIDTFGIITTVVGNAFGAGTGTGRYSGDGGPALAAELFAPIAIAFNPAGELLIADGGNHVIRKVNRSGIISTFAGNGIAGFSGDGGPATAASLQGGFGFAFDLAGNTFFSDATNNRIRKVDAAGQITTYAGTGAMDYTGDGGPAIFAELATPNGLIMDGVGNLVFSDDNNNALRKVSGIGGVTNICLGDTTTLVDEHTPGGTWYSSDALVALVTAPGRIKGVTAGTASIYYVLGTDTASTTVLVSSNPTAGTIIAPDSMCLNVDQITLKDSTPGGLWNIPVFFFPATAGIHHITYSIPYTCRTVIASKDITVIDATPCCISGPDTVCVGDTVMLRSSSVPGGMWGLVDSTLATIVKPGYIKGLAPGEEFAIYTVNGGIPGCILSSYFTLNVVDCAPLVAPLQNRIDPEITVYPNPAYSRITIKGAKIKELVIIDYLGRDVYKNTFDQAEVSININSLPTGVYMLRINGTEMKKFVKE